MKLGIELSKLDDRTPETLKDTLGAILKQFLKAAESGELKGFVIDYYHDDGEGVKVSSFVSGITSYEEKLLKSLIDTAMNNPLHDFPFYGDPNWLDGVVPSQESALAALFGNMHNLDDSEVH